VYDDDASIEEFLALDPCGAYPLTDSSTRADCRAIIRFWSSRANLPCAEIARRILEKATRAHQSATSTVAATHVGYYVIDDGARQFEAEIGLRLSARRQLCRFFRRHSPLLCHATVALLTVVILGCLVVFLAHHRIAWPWRGSLPSSPRRSRFAIPLG